LNWDKNENISQASKWLKRHVELIEEKGKLLAAQKTAGFKAPIKTIYRAGVYYAELGEGNIGGEKNKTRPVLVLSPNRMNRGNTVLIAPLSTKFEKKPNGLPLYDNHYLLKKMDYPALREDSAVKFEDIRSVDVVRLSGLVFNVKPQDMGRMQSCIKFILGY